ncbi:methyltransferase [Coniochaeta sp. 2T2.1]|nr:methyltransferase [Coniochaeta sp. 2T2.1]
MEFGSEPQPQSAQRMYDSRAAKYDNSWHPSYATRFTSHLSISPGDTVLDLCCGTGLNVFAAADRVGADGRVIGIDISEGMLAVARQKQAADLNLSKSCLLLKGDVMHLDDVFAAAGLGDRGGTFDGITCCSGLVLLDDPVAALRHWKAFLKPQGRMAIDVPHQHNLRAGVILERVAKRLGVAMPFNRSWVESSESFVKLAAEAGLELEQTGGQEVLERVMGEGITSYGVDEADEQLDKVTKGSLTAGLDVEEFRERARPLFREEWERAAVDGRVEVADALYLYVVRKSGQE